MRSPIGSRLNPAAGRQRREARAAPRLLRRGKVAGYRDDFDATQLAQIDRVVETTLDPLYGYTERASEGAA